jgi:hypothetical protein
MKKNYREKIKLAMGRPYQELFPLVESLRTKRDVEEFMEAYVDAVHEKIRLDLTRGRDTRAVQSILMGDVSVRDEAKRVSLDNLSLLANVYEANKGKKVQRSWSKVMDKICATS